MPCSCLPANPVLAQASIAGREPVAALCYNLAEPPPPDERDPDYASRLRALAARLNFPAEYVASIQ